VPHSTTTATTANKTRGGNSRWGKAFAPCDIRLGVLYRRGAKTRRPVKVGTCYTQVGGPATFMCRGEVAVACRTEHGELLTLSPAHLAAWALTAKPGREGPGLRQSAEIKAWQARVKAAEVTS